MCSGRDGAVLGRNRVPQFQVSMGSDRRWLEVLMVPTGSRGSEGGSRFRWVPTGSGVSKVRAPVGTMQLAMLLFEEFFLHLWKQEFSEKTSLLFLDTTCTYAYFFFVFLFQSSFICFFVDLVNFLVRPTPGWVSTAAKAVVHRNQRALCSSDAWGTRGKDGHFLWHLHQPRWKEIGGLGALGSGKTWDRWKLTGFWHTSYYGWWFRNPARKPPDMIETLVNKGIFVTYQLVNAGFLNESTVVLVTLVVFLMWEFWWCLWHTDGGIYVKPTLWQECVDDSTTWTITAGWSTLSLWKIRDGGCFFLNCGPCSWWSWFSKPTVEDSNFLCFYMPLWNSGF